MESGLFEELADNAPVMIWRSGIDMLCDFFNKPWLDFTGRTLDQEFGVGWTLGIHSEDFDRCRQTYATAFAARSRFSVEYRLRRHDGSYGWLLDHGKPFFRQGVFAGYFGSCIDISERKHLEDSRDILVDELNHRVKNTLSTVQAIAAQSFRTAVDIGDASHRFDGRIMALSRVHEILTAENWKGVSLEALVAGILGAHAYAGARIRYTGPHVYLEPSQAQSLAMALHELSTNAATFGALSNDRGHIVIEWALSKSTGSGQLTLRWTESEGPTVVAPSRHGFGLRLITSMLPRDIDGHTTLDFEPGGLVSTVSFPLHASRGS